MSPSISGACWMRARSTCSRPTRRGAAAITGFLEVGGARRCASSAALGPHRPGLASSRVLRAPAAAARRMVPRPRAHRENVLRRHAGSEEWRDPARPVAPRPRPRVQARRRRALRDLRGRRRFRMADVAQSAQPQAEIEHAPTAGFPDRRTDPGPEWPNPAPLTRRRPVSTRRRSRKSSRPRSKARCASTTAAARSTPPTPRITGRCRSAW